MSKRQLLEHLERRGLRLCLGRSPDRLGAHPELVEQDLRQFFGRVDVEFLSCVLVDLRGEPAEFRFDVAGLRGQRGAVDTDAGALDVHQHRHERPFHVFVEPLQFLLLQQLSQRAGHLQRQVGALAGVIENPCQRGLRKRNGLGAAAANVLLTQRLVPGMLEREILELVCRPGRIEQVARQHGVGFQPAQRHAVLREDDRIEFQIVPDLRDPLVLENRLQHVEHLPYVEHLAAPFAFEVGAKQAAAASALRHRDVARFAGHRGERDADDGGPHGGGGVGNHAKREPPCGLQLGSQRRDRVRGLHQSVVLADRLGRWRVLHDERPESEPGEQLEAHGRRRPAIAKRFGIELNGHVGADAGQLAALSSVLRVVEKPLALALVRDFGSVGQQVLQVAVGRDQIAGTLLADSGNTLDVVDGVAH